MSDETQNQHQIVHTIIRNVMIKTGLVVGIGTAAGLMYALTQSAEPRWWFMPGSILFGGALGFLNFRWLSFAVERKLKKSAGGPSEPSNPVVTIINILKLAAVFIVLFIVSKWRLVHMIGFIIGLTLFFLALLWEGLAFVSNSKNRAE
jgi:hypothetical protein